MFRFPFLHLSLHLVVKHPAHIPHYPAEERNHHAENGIGIILTVDDEHINGCDS